MLESLGAQAIGTSSGAHAFTLGRLDGGTVSRDDALAHAQDLIAAVKVPVSGDFENGYGDAPEDCAETVRLSAEIGLAGISIEDEDFATGDAYAFDLAVERIKAAAAAARALPKDFVLVARADGVMNNRYNLAEAIRRIQAFDAAGADCLYVPVPPDIAGLRQVIATTNKPINALTVGPLADVSHAEFAAMGVARISLGSALSKVAHRAVHDAALQMLNNGDFRALKSGLPGATIAKLLQS